MQILCVLVVALATLVAFTFAANSISHSDLELVDGTCGVWQNVIAKHVHIAPQPLNMQKEQLVHVSYHLRGRATRAAVELAIFINKQEQTEGTMSAAIDGSRELFGSGTFRLEGNVHHHVELRLRVVCGSSERPKLEAVNDNAVLLVVYVSADEKAHDNLVQHFLESGLSSLLTRLPESPAQKARAYALGDIACQATRSRPSFTGYPHDPQAQLNLYIGTGGDGYGVGALPMGPQVPFGMARVGPDTTIHDLDIAWRHPGGYSYCDTEIKAFSHVHMVGSGVLDLGLVGVMPVTQVSAVVALGGAYLSPFDHSTEVMRPGYYAVTLDRWGVRAEMTATQHVGFHRQTFPVGQQQFVIVDLAHSIQVLNSQQPDTDITVDPATRQIFGVVHNSGGYSNRVGGARVFFVIQFASAPITFGVFDNYALTAGKMSINSAFAGAYVGFGTATSKQNVIEYQVAVSFVSIDQARANLVAEGQVSFDVAEAAAASQWAKILGMVELTGGSDSDQMEAMTMFYHAFLAPTNFTEAGGVHRGIDAQVHTGSWFTDMSLWDTHRTQASMLSLFAPDAQLQIVNALIEDWHTGGALPRWPFLDGYTGGMIGSHAFDLIIDAYMKGIRGFDTETAYAAMYDQATNANAPHGRGGGWTQCTELGFCPESVCPTLEFAYSDGLLADYAAALGKTMDSAMFLNHSHFYRNTFDPKSQFYCPRSANGTFSCSLDPCYPFDSHYTEGDAWHYRFYGYHDPVGMIELFGSNETLTTLLNELFERATPFMSQFLPNPYYWAGNEEDIVYPYIFHYTHHAELTTKWVRWNMQNRFNNSAYNGLPGNDDYGTMSSWYFFGSIGLFPLTGKPFYFLGAPQFDKTVLHLPGGDVTITAHGAGPQNTLITKALLNGVQLDNSAPFIPHQDIVNGGTIEVWLAPQ
eukprot:TRINITY_DN6145_c0_g2_i1.p1 TRINITY_DN6145_c0_g2~~TRINITY_DN6145_c0_g2_i1.p1  ORF type:complete len:920 (-),score=172.62 TRINITY_DN6145_c0_g2_i1:1401-4160(-)